MIDLISLKKNKVCLNDYDYKSDLKNRLQMAHFTILDLAVLEEIIYSPLKISLHQLAENLDIEINCLFSILEKFVDAGLLTSCNDNILVDKEMRKYYEIQMLKFQEGFVPTMEYLQSLLRKVPMHVLPQWYSIPRISDNIFDSIVEKYLLTPQIFERYLEENLHGDSAFACIAKIVHRSPDLKVLGSDLMHACRLSREEFEEQILHLEFNFLCCLGYEKVDNQWKEIVTPFHEWREYKRFVHSTQVIPLPFDAAIEYTEPLDKFSELEVPSYLRTDKNMREIEKSLTRIEKQVWVYFDDFFKGIRAPLTEKSTVLLKKNGKGWKYQLPEYNTEEKNLVKEMIFSTLAKTGVILTGKHEGKECFLYTRSN